MRVLILCLFVASCGGSSGTVPSLPEPLPPFKSINLEGTWKLSITIPECDREFKSTYYVAINDNSHDLLSTMMSLGEYPDPDNMAACNSKIIPDIVDLSPYTTSSSAIQFREFLSVRFLWDYNGIDIIEYSDRKISLLRTVQTLVGERVWSYEYTHIKNQYGSMERYDITLLNDGIVVVNGCEGIYTTTFGYFEAIGSGADILGELGPYLEYLQITNENPLLAIGNPCEATNEADMGFLPTYYPSAIVPIEFKTLMQGVWGEPTSVLSWYPDDIMFIRKTNGHVAGYIFKIPNHK